MSVLNALAGDTSLGAVPGRSAAYVHVGGLSDLPGGPGGLTTYLYRWNDYQFYDDATYLHGTHSFKFGFYFERMLLRQDSLQDINGKWFFGNLQDFLTNVPSEFQIGTSGSATRNSRQSILGAYLQDDWQVKQTLTFNLGLRYEMATVPIETNGQFDSLRNLSDPLPICGTFAPGCAGEGPLFSNPTLLNFEPRFGFAWDPLGNGKMAVRGGVGMFDILPLPYQFFLTENKAAPFFSQATVKNGLSFFTAPTQLPPTSLTAAYITPHPDRNYVVQYNLNVQYQLAPSLAMMVAYVGSEGIHMLHKADDGNLAMPTPTSAGGGYLFPHVDALGNLWDPTLGCTQTDPNGSDPSSCAAPLEINPYYGTVRYQDYSGRSYYNAMQIQVSKRMSHGIQMQGSFTWGRSIDTSSAAVAGDTFGNSISSLPMYNLRLTRAPSDFNVDRTFVFNALWDVPGIKSGFAAARWISNGWELGGIITLSDGVPFTPTWGTGGDPANTLSSDDYAYPDVLRGKPGCSGSLVNPGNPYNYIKTDCFSVPTAPNAAYWNANCDPAPPSLGATISSTSYLPALACFNLMGNARRNSLIGPGVANVDFSVYKNNYIRSISESFNLQFRAEFFNIMNHPDFQVPTTGDGNNDIFDSTGASLAGSGGTAGVLVNTTVPERQIQFALKVIF